MGPDLQNYVPRHLGFSQTSLRTSHFSHSVQHPEDWSSVTLLLDPFFMAKTERACYPDTRLQEVALKALAPFVGPDLSTDANNCVVCAVKI